MRNLLLALLLALSASIMAQDYQAAYASIEALANEGKYQSALEEAEALYQRAEADGDEDDMVKSLAYRAAYTLRLREEGIDETLKLLRTELAENGNRPVVRSLLHFMMGSLYFQYGQENSYRLRNATEVKDSPLPPVALPLEEWSLLQLMDIAETELYAGLQSARAVRTRLSEIPAITSFSEERLAERPTIYDALMWESMEMLASPGLSVNDPRPEAPERFLVPGADFISLELTELFEDTDNSTYRKLKLYQELMAYHPADSEARMYADRDRLRYIHQLGAADEAYYLSLQTAFENYAGVRGRECFRLSQASLLVSGYEGRGPNPKAIALNLLKGLNNLPPALRAEAEGLKNSITARNLRVEGENIYPLNQPLLFKIDYRNVGEVHHRIVREPEQLDRNGGYYGNLSQDELKLVLRQPVVKRSQFTMPENDDYNGHTTETYVPGLPTGRYLLVTSSGKNFDLEKDIISVNGFQSTNLALLRFDDSEADYLEVVDRLTGAPRAGVEVEYQVQRNRSDAWRTTKRGVSDARGRIDVPTGDRNSVKIILRDPAQQDEMVTDPNYYRIYRDNGNRRARPYTPLFTDRNIYRPGQTVFIYGLSLRRGKDNMPTILKREEMKISLLDANRQEVGTATARSDAYGRFDLSFKLPDGGLTGMFSVQAEGGSVRFRVEEYKRPRFQVTLEVPEAAVAGEDTEVTGEAKLFAGPGLADATVNYRVFLKEQRYFYFFRGGGGNERELVDSGAATTAADGSFTFGFTPATGLNEGRRRFVYEIEADVVDATGETQTTTASLPLRNDKPLVMLSVAEELVAFRDSLTLRASGPEDQEALSVTYRIHAATKPGTALRDRTWTFPDRPVISPTDYKKLFPELAAESEMPVGEWPVTDAPLLEGTLRVEAGKAEVRLPVNWPTGHYVIAYTYPDGTEGERTEFAVFNPGQNELPPGELYHLMEPTGPATVGASLEYTLISALPLPEITYSWASRRGVRSGVTDANNRRATFTYVPTPEDRGGIQLDLAFLRLNALHQRSYRIALPWRDKELKVEYATFRDQLRPGTPEQWTLTVSNADGSPVPAAALATMYDASLDVIFSRDNWFFSPFPAFQQYRNFVSFIGTGNSYGYGQDPVGQRIDVKVPALPRLDIPMFPAGGGYRNIDYYDAVEVRGMAAGQALRKSAAPAPAMAMEEAEAVAYNADAGGAPPPPPPPPAPEDNSPVQIRKDLQETAFWQPDLTVDQDGKLTIKFDSPEALTKWKFRLFTHDADLAYAVSTKEVVTRKELMVLPNPPRFVREGDQLELTARVENLTDAPMDVEAEIEFFNPATDQSIDFGVDAGANPCVTSLRLPAESGDVVCFPLSIPEGMAADGPLGYRIIVRGGEFSDGEENVMPVLTDRTLITVTEAFYLRRKGKETITLDALANANSESLRHVSYTFQATTNPAWLALKALPYLMEYPYDCTEQIANRFFANQLAYATVSNRPVLEEVFRKWQDDPEALKSELERNASLKNALLTETPWLREARDEAQQRQRIGELFDLKRLAKEQNAALDKLVQRQDAEGSFGWFPGGYANRYMTQYVVETMARLDQLGVITSEQQSRVAEINVKAISYLDGKMLEDYQRLFRDATRKEELRETYVPSSTVVHYLYARSMSESAAPQDKNVRDALTFFRERAYASWTKYGFYEQALIAIAAERERAASSYAGKQLSTLILESFREQALTKEEFGMYWKYGRGFRWQTLPIETHCRILEAFQAVDGTEEELDEMKLWLLTNKRTNRWSTTKSTAAAVYALLNAGSDWTAVQPEAIRVSWPDAATDELGTRVRAAQTSAEAATGAFSVAVTAPAISQELARVKVRNRNNNVVWGGIYWQYTDLAQKVAASNDGPLTLERELFRRVPTGEGMRLEPLSADQPLKAGDRVTVRLILRSDRELDYVHLKDRRAATFEPAEQLSGYNYEGGLGYYYAPGDLATNFFIDHLPKGTHTIEYEVYATYSGSFSNGLGRVQCMYAPEFGANTSGARIVVE
ncbi:alpha-2-macroglobulin [Lewinella sp. W8]|uniref:alpha-2-macroglobulin family protein n=1 Tax=Lewinella sp. W8 TaxID=2528208 RepID=UPI0010680763|nr:alpha-2-macroglobulin family protein [Lewinella sp. W8]MTB52879.1 hypothetical protein [Lewinella sp. W8]